MRRSETSKADFSVPRCDAFGWQATGDHSRIIYGLRMMTRPPRSRCCGGGGMSGEKAAIGGTPSGGSGGALGGRARDNKSSLMRLALRAASA